MDKYQTIRQAVETATKAIIGMPTTAAAIYLHNAHLKYRVVEVDGEHAMITADCKFDRLNLTIQRGIVIRAIAG